jgi:hypothetical protein
LEIAAPCFFAPRISSDKIDRRRLLELASAAAQLEHAGPMQSAVSIDRFRPPIVIRAFNRFGAMLNGKVSRCIPPEELIEAAKRRSNLNDFGDGDFREALGRLLESCWRDARLNAIGTIALRSDVLRNATGVCILKSHSTRSALLFLWWDCRGLARPFCTPCFPLIRLIARR